MALFNNEENMEPNHTSSSTSSNEIETVIGPSVKVEGNFKSDGDVTVNGSVQGSLETTRDLKVGDTAKIKAEIKANNLFLKGEIRGNVFCSEKAHLSGTAKVLGNITTKKLVVEDGAQINGKCSMGSDLKPEEEKTEKTDLKDSKKK